MKFITIFFIFCFVQINLYTLYCNKTKKNFYTNEFDYKIFYSNKKKSNNQGYDIFYIYAYMIPYLFSLKIFFN